MRKSAGPSNRAQHLAWPPAARVDGSASSPGSTGHARGLWFESAMAYQPLPRRRIISAVHVHRAGGGRHGIRSWGEVRTRRGGG